MNINDMINGSNKHNGNLINLESLINSVKAEDEKNIRINRSFQWVYIIMVVVFAVLIFFHDPDVTPIRQISGIFFLASMIAFALIFRKSYKENKSIDYSLPVIDMLRNVANRYSLKLKKNFHLISIPIILMDIGLTLSHYNDLLPMSPLNRILIVQAFYIPAMTISALIGVWVWSKKQKPLRDRALELIKELESI